jgi:hypothetical protein
MEITMIRLVLMSLLSCLIGVTRSPVILDYPNGFPAPSISRDPAHESGQKPCSTASIALAGSFQVFLPAKMFIKGAARIKNTTQSPYSS